MSPFKLALAVFSTALLQPLAFAGVSFEELPGGKVRVEVAGKFFTEYRFAETARPYLYPVIGPGGAKMTRAWPMEDVAGEEHDHPHHRSIWFTHGNVNGVDFWTEEATHKATPKHPMGHILQEKFVEIKGGDKVGVLSASLKWVAPDGSIPLTSIQTLRFHDRSPSTEQILDFEVTLTASKDKDAVFGDTKEGSMGIRIAESMRMVQPRNKPGLGHILNNAGDKDGEVWGKRAAWVDMSGPVDGKTVGIAMFDHPSNLRHPTRWHARDYGLFAANPFCEREMDKTQPEGAGAYTLPAGKSLTLRYRILFHEGDGAQAQLPARFEEYVKSVK